MKRKFDAYEVAMETVAALGPVLEQIRRKDPDLARQLRRAMASVPLNLSEGACRTGRDRAHAYRIAYGSAQEARTALRIALAWKRASPASWFHRLWSLRRTRSPVPGTRSPVSGTVRDLLARPTEAAGRRRYSSPGPIGKKPS